MRARRGQGRAFAATLVCAAVAACSGCRATYLARLAVEEVRFLHGAKPVTEMLASTRDPERRRALEALVSVREFAEAEGLDVGGSYRKVAETASSTPFQVVTAAWSDRLEPFTWWYPVIGAIPYRGYFDRESAEAFAAGLKAQGLDTMVVEASAYSTLGWFDDPLPASVLARGDGAVIVTVLHELVHQTFFAPGEVALNETLATAVAWRLAERYFAAKGNEARAVKVRQAREAWVARSDVLDAAAARLQVFFDDAHRSGLSHERMMTDRAVLYADIVDGIARADPAFGADLATHGLNNAVFLADYRYATGGHAIDNFLASRPSIADALKRLNDALRRKEDLRAVVETASIDTPRN